MSNQYFENIELTENAARIYKTFLDQVKGQSDARNISWEHLQQYIAGQAETKLQGQEGAVDAEKLMSAVDSIGPIKDLLDRYEASVAEAAQAAAAQAAAAQATQPKTSIAPTPPAPPAQPASRRLQRSPEHKVITGVCGGIAEYFQVDPALVRIIYALGCVFTGMWPGVLVYIILSLSLPKPTGTINSPDSGSSKETPSSAPAPISSPAAPGATPLTAVEKPIDALPQQPKSLMRRLFGVALFLFLGLFFYLPMILFSLGGATYCLWGIFYPIMNIDGFHFSFMQLGIPGYVLAVSVSILLFCLFLLVMALMTQLHFKVRFLYGGPLAITAIAVILSLFAGISAAVMIGFQNKEEFKREIVKSIPLKAETQNITLDQEQLQNLRHGTVKLYGLNIKSDEKAKGIQVKCIVKARGNSTDKAQEYCEKIKLEWTDGTILPRISKDNPEFHFEDMALEMTVPQNKNLNISGAVRKLQLTGQFMDLKLDLRTSRSEADKVVAQNITIKNKSGLIRLHDIQGKTIDIHNRSSALRMNKMVCEKLTIDSKAGHVKMYDCKCAAMKITNRQGMMRIVRCEGALQCDHSQAMLRLEQHVFPEKSESSLKTNRGITKIILDPKQLPTIKINDQDRGIIKNKLRNYPGGTATFTIDSDRGILKLIPYQEKY